MPDPSSAPHHAGAAADRVASIVSAAEAAADRIRHEAERRLTERIAEAERAAENRVRAAEEEAVELVTEAQARARDTLAAADTESAERRTAASSEALTTVGRAQESAEAMLAEAKAEAERVTADAQTRARTQLREAREIAGEVKSEGLELVTNLRQMGDALRANAERLLRDVQGIHSRMVAELDQGDAAAGQYPAAPRSRATTPTPAPPRRSPVADLDVPEFIPPS